MTEPAQPTMFKDISGDDGVTEMESFCVNCEGNGTTRLLLTKIPFFQEVVVISFSCDHCGYRNNEIQTVGKLKDQGTRINVRLTHPKDLNRDVIKSEYATLRIPELDFEIPPVNRKGSLNTIEGLLQNAIDGLVQNQANRKETDPALYEKIEEFIAKLEKLRKGEGFPFRVILDDPSGNSYIKNPFAPNSDCEMKIEKYYRTKEQCETMGFDYGNQQLQEEEEKKENEETGHKNLDFTKTLTEDLNGESMVFKVPCHCCQQMGESKMCSVTIPYFKQLIIMAFTCDFCGAKSREVKTGGEISEKAKKITLSVECEDDLKRDVFKSETAVLQIPELEIELLMGTLGGIYSTVEGLLVQVRERLFEDNPFVGDSDAKFKDQMAKVLAALNECIEVKRPFTMILDDPLSNSFIQNPYYPDPDPRVKVHIYNRTLEQNDELGLTDMKTENY